MFFYWKKYFSIKKSMVIQWSRAFTIESNKLNETGDSTHCVKLLSVEWLEKKIELINNCLIWYDWTLIYSPYHDGDKSLQIKRNEYEFAIWSSIGSIRFLLANVVWLKCYWIIDMKPFIQLSVWQTLFYRVEWKSQLVISLVFKCQQTW